MAKDQDKFGYDAGLFDARTMEQKIADFMQKPDIAISLFVTVAVSLIFFPELNVYNNLIFIIIFFYYIWYRKRDIGLVLKYPMQVKGMKNHKECAKADGMLYLGNNKNMQDNDNREIWLSNSDARTHILFLGTTGSGKTEGLKTISTNALSWGSGFVYVDGKADTDLWASLYSIARRFGRDDDLLLLNYMTGNSDKGGQSHSMNPFANGSASYLTNLLVGLMDESGGDNAMWKGRAISLMTAIMPALTWQRDNENLLLDVDTIRRTLTLDKVIALTRSKSLPKKISKGVYGYLDTLPGYVDSAFDDEGKEKPQGPDDTPHDLSTCYQQHGFLSMQFTRSLGSLADEYGYIFKHTLADIDIHDVVLNRRMMIVMIPILEKSGDEAANLGKIVASSIKGMMGATLGSDVEGSWENIIENKVTRANSPFVTIFDEVGYYTSQGMAAMAAQARSLGFSLVFAGQDLAAMEKRVKEEAKSITANCNLKIFGKLEDPGPTKDFFEKNASQKMDILTQGSFELKSGFFGSGYSKKENMSTQNVAVVKYDDLRRQGLGHVHMIFASKIIEVQMPYMQPPRYKSLRLNRLIKVEAGVSSSFRENMDFSEYLMNKYNNPDWKDSTDPGVVGIKGSQELLAIKEIFDKSKEQNDSDVKSSTVAVASMFGEETNEGLEEFAKFFDNDDKDSNVENTNDSDDDPFAFPRTFSDQNKKQEPSYDSDMDDFQKMLESYKQNDFNDKPPFSEVSEEISEVEKKKEIKKVLKPIVNIDNELPWEEQGKEISDDIIYKALDDIWGREKINTPVKMLDSKKDMSSDFMTAMKKYIKEDNMEKENIIKAVLRATADLISNNMSSPSEVKALTDMAEEISEEKEELMEESDSEDISNKEAVVEEKESKEDKKESTVEESLDIVTKSLDDDSDEDFEEFFS